MPAALKLAQQICSNAPLSVHHRLRAVEQVIGRDDDEAWQATADAIEALRGSRDTLEGIAAFFERRPPQWEAR